MLVEEKRARDRALRISAWEAKRLLVGSAMFRPAQPLADKTNKKYLWKILFKFKQKSLC